MLVHFVISHRPIAFSQVLLLRLSHSNHHHLLPSPPSCFIFPSPRLRHIPYSTVRSCGLTAVFPLHVNLKSALFVACPCRHCSVANLWQYLSRGADGCWVREGRFTSGG